MCTLTSVRRNVFTFLFLAMAAAFLSLACWCLSYQSDCYDRLSSIWHASCCVRLCWNLFENLSWTAKNSWYLIFLYNDLMESIRRFLIVRCSPVEQSYNTWNFTGDYNRITLFLYRSLCLHVRGSWHFSIVRLLYPMTDDSWCARLFFNLANAAIKWRRPSVILQFVVSEFELQSFSCIHFWTNNLGNSRNPLIFNLWVKYYRYFSFTRMALEFEWPKKVDMQLNKEIECLLIYCLFICWDTFVNLCGGGAFYLFMVLVVGVGSITMILSFVSDFFFCFSPYSHVICGNLPENCGRKKRYMDTLILISLFGGLWPFGGIESFPEPVDVVAFPRQVEIY